MQDPVTIKEKVRGSDLGRGWGVREQPSFSEEVASAVPWGMS